MERKIYHDEFEQLLKEKSDEFRMYPSKRVWHSIYNDLHPGRKWPSLAMTLLLVMTLVLIGYLNSEKTSPSSLNSGLENSKLSRYNGNHLTGNEQSGLPGQGNPSQDVAFNSKQNFTALDNQPEVSAGRVFEGFTGYGEQINTPPANLDLVAAVDHYIRTNQLFNDIAAIAAGPEKKTAFSTASPVDRNSELNEFDKDANVLPGNASNNTVQVDPEKNTENPESQTGHLTGTKPVAVSGTLKKEVSGDDKAWIEDYALHNKSERKKWKDRAALEMYATPGIGYRTLGSNLSDDAATVAQSAAGGTTNPKSVSQIPSLGMEAGIGINYAVARNLRLKGGLQFNYTSYGINADATNHPILTTLMLNDPSTGHAVLSTRSSTLANSSGLNPVTVHNKTYQVSLPVGFALKLAGNSSLEWYAGASLQPTYIFGGSADFISTDYSSYVSDPSLIRKWNLNTGFETYVNYKLGGYSLQVGPQLRYQLFSTYNNRSITTEKLYNAGLKIGLVKGF